MTINKNYFVNNGKFLELLDEFKETKVLSEELGRVFVDMTKNLMFSKQFINYSDDWKAEMSSDALYNCCRYAGTFDKSKSINPFAYFTRTIINAFIMRIKKEKRSNLKEDVLRKQAYEEFMGEHGLYDDNKEMVDYDGEQESE